MNIRKYLKKGKGLCLHIMYKWLLLLFFLFGTSHGTDSVNITVLYRPKCGLCKRFIVNQLFRTWQQYYENIHMKMVIYMPEFYQQNKDSWNVNWIPKGDPRLLHMCASYEACGDQGTLGCKVPNMTKYVNYIHCDLRGDPLDESAHCATEASLDPDFKKCQDSELALRLISYHASNTVYVIDHFGQEFDTLPFLLLNGVYKEEEYHKAMHNLTAVICDYIKC